MYVFHFWKLTLPVKLTERRFRRMNRLWRMLESRADTAPGWVRSIVSELDDFGTAWLNAKGEEAIV